MKETNVAWWRVSVDGQPQGEVRSVKSRFFWLRPGAEPQLMGSSMPEVVEAIKAATGGVSVTLDWAAARKEPIAIIPGAERFPVVGSDGRWPRSGYLPDPPKK